ncbi:MAG TPA: prenyltransferase/squalene oxidase repeat-containing protein [Candidatus Sulfotelmatobacter sp.]|nr:prenyltransferase/squalene oxidase repeat-containing protein [Candidatus Sulfotelmatobacter sp.]
MEEAIKTLLDTDNEALTVFTKRNLLGEEVDVEELWFLPQVERILKNQQSDGSWIYPNKKATLRSPTNYNQYQTYKTIAELVEFYGLNKKHDAIRKTAKYLFSFQTKEGEFRGIYGNQYSPNYSASITEFLIKAGYGGIRIEKSLDWLLRMRHDDGGWAIPLRTRNRELEALNETETIEPDKTKPFSHLVTGIVLRPLSLVTSYRRKVKDIGILLADRVFTKDKYSDRKGVEYWTKFTFPYHWTDILSTIDTLTLLGINNHPKIKEIMHWFEKHKQDNGIYEVNVMAGAKYTDIKYWITLQYLTVLRRAGIKFLI